MRHGTAATDTERRNVVGVAIAALLIHRGIYFEFHPTPKGRKRVDELKFSSRLALVCGVAVSFL